MKKSRILIIEDDPLSRLNLKTFIGTSPLITESDNFLDAKNQIEQNSFDLIFIDLDLEEELLGLQLIEIAKYKKAYTIVVSGREENRYIESAYQKGCHDYLSKPFNKKSLNIVMARYKLMKDQGTLKQFFLNDYITQDKDLIKKLQIIKEIVISNEPVLITGATGTGKSIIAKLIHKLIFDNSNNFIQLNCSETPENLLESELFGYEPGAFSGAQKSKKGKLLLADGGTLFLDELGTMPPILQQKLLKAIEDKTFYPLGSEKPVTSNFRLISATCDNLKQLVNAQKFRLDLFYRIDGFNIELSPLKNRIGDIPLLIKHFLKSSTRRIVIKDDVIDLLSTYRWPGNIRELEKTIEILTAKDHGIISISDLPDRFLNTNQTLQYNRDCSRNLLPNISEESIRENGLKKTLEDIENTLVQHFYKRNKQKVRITLKDLKISNSSFYKVLNRMKENQLEN